MKEGRFEIAAGGWTDISEGGLNLYSMIDQLIEGQHWLGAHLNVSAQTAWSVNAYGHGSALPYILSLAGIKTNVIMVGSITKLHA